MKNIKGTERKQVTTEVAAIRAAFESASSFVVVGHVRPDGDAVGAVLGLTHSLKLIGKKVLPVIADGVPARFRFLPGASDVQSRLAEDFDLAVALDCSDLGRTGFETEWQNGKPDINIDHHPTNTNFANLNLVDPQAAATSEMLCSHAEQLGLKIDQQVATNYLAGLVTDTLGFRTSNVTSATLHNAARLVDYGAPLAELYHRTLSKRTFASARYWGEGLKKLTRDGSIIWTALSLEARDQSDYPGWDDADLINLLTTIDEARVSIVFVEQPGGKIKVSWRSEPGVNVAEVAATFGGGGHAQASGAMVTGGLSDVTSNVLEATQALLSANGDG
jgi:phosphoesterase RecJ-like protein